MSPPLTFLQFVCDKLLGPPAKHGAPGESYWLCPLHHDKRPSFHTLPHRAGMRDYWRCFGCGAWGDEFELMKQLGIGETFADRAELLQKWREEFEQLITDVNVNGENNRLFSWFSSPLTLSVGSIHRDASYFVNQAWGGILSDLRAIDCRTLPREDIAFRICQSFQRRCDENNVSPAAVIKFWSSLWDCMLDRVIDRGCD